MSWRRIKSFLYLAVAFWKRRLRRLIKGKADDGGAERFLDNFVVEGMEPLSLQDESLLLALGRCIHCGLCEAVCPEPMDKLTVYSRAITMADAAAASVPTCEAGCQACVKICPTGVPLLEIPAFLNRW